MQILFVYFFVNVFIAFVVIYNLKLYDCQVYTQTKKCNDKNNRTATTTTMTRWWRRLNLRTVAKFDVINFYQNEKKIYIVHCGKLCSRQQPKIREYFGWCFSCLKVRLAIIPLPNYTRLQIV